MSHILVNAYLAEIDRLKKVSGKTTEQVVREAFKDLLKTWSKSAGLIFVAELEHETGLRSKVYPDGTVLHELRVPLGFWEAKDTATAILWQNGRETLRCPMADVAQELPSAV